MDAKDKYKMFKNYMFNELGISKEDIREWIKESIEIEVKRVIDCEFGNINISELITKQIYKNRNLFYGDRSVELSDSIKSKVAAELVKYIKISTDYPKDKY